MVITEKTKREMEAGRKALEVHRPPVVAEEPTPPPPLPDPVEVEIQSPKKK